MIPTGWVQIRSYFRLETYIFSILTPLGFKVTVKTHMYENCQYKL